MSNENEQKALKVLAEAEKKGKTGGGFLGGLFGAGKGEEASELYVKAANLFKMAKNWEQAGGAFVKSAELQAKSDSKFDAATNYVEAANCYRKTRPQVAVDCLQKAIDIYTDMGRFTMAAKQHTVIAEIFEGEIADFEKSMIHHEKAADYYKGEESKSAANKSLLKVAQYAAQLEQYKKAIGIYEEVGTAAADNNLLKYSAKDYFFRAALCHLCIDLLDTQHALKRYEDIHPAFSDSRECKLLKLMIALEEQNVDEFTDAVKEYDKLTRLDQWFTTLLLRIKKSMGEETDLR